MEENKILLRDASQLHNREYMLEEWIDGEWVSKGEVNIFPEGMFVNGEFIKNPTYHHDQKAVKYSFGSGNDHKAGRLLFDDYYMAFVGSYQASDGDVITVRGNSMETTYKTKETCGKIERDGKDFTVGTRWADDGTLQAYYKLGDEDITEGTAISHVDNTTWETTIERTSYGLMAYDFTFNIVVDFTATKFSGTCKYDLDENTYNWTGTALEKEKSLKEKRNKLCADLARLLSEEKEDVGDDTLSLQALINVNQYYIDSKNNTLVDKVQQEAGSYYEKILINALPEDTRKKFFEIQDLPQNVQQTAKKYSEYYSGKSVMNMGYLLYTNLKDSPIEQDKAACSKINIDKIKQELNDQSSDTEYPGQASELYRNAYANIVEDIQNYMKDGKGWAKKLYDHFTNEAFLSIWRAQIASSQFSNVKQHIYEIYTKMMVLDNSEEGCNNAREAVNIMFSSVVYVASQKMNWMDEYKDEYIKLLNDALRDLLNGKIDDFSSDLEKKTVEELHDYLSEVAAMYESMDSLAEDLADLLCWISQKGGDISEALDSAGQESGLKNIVDRLGSKIKTSGVKLLRALGCTVAVGLCIYIFVSPNASKSVIADIGLSICMATILAHGAISLMESKLGRWITEKISGIGENAAEFSSNFSKWFSKDESITGVAAKIFGKNAEEFMRTRLGPICAIANIVLSSFFIRDAIKQHDTFNTVMEGLNIAFAGADLVCIGLSMLSFSWAGPVGIAVAAIGALVALVQLVVNIIQKPKHQEDDVEKFVYGPLKEAGYVLA